MTEEQSDAYIVGVIFAQHFSLKKGLELFGEKADPAVHKELEQIHKMDTYEPMYKADLSIEDRLICIRLMDLFQFLVNCRICAFPQRVPDLSLG